MLWRKNNYIKVPFYFFSTSSLYTISKSRVLAGFHFYLLKEVNYFRKFDKKLFKEPTEQNSLFDPSFLQFTSARTVNQDKRKSAGIK